MARRKPPPVVLHRPLKEMIVDHRAYLGAAGFAFCFGTLLSRFQKNRFAFVVIVLLAARSIQYEWVLADPVRAWEDAVYRAPDSADAYRALAEAYASRGDPRSGETFKQAVQRNPRDVRSWANLGVFYAQRGRLDEAVEAMHAAARAAPRDARIQDNLGLMLQAQGRDDEAIAAFEAAVAASRTLAQPRIDLAAILLRHGNRARARELLDEAAALEIAPQDAQAIKSLRAQLR